MEKEQELEWTEAQKIATSVDLVAAAKQQLRFLSDVNRNHHLLHEGPSLDRAIDRYKYCWLPLLAKHEESQVSEGPLVAPLDCEWIWHCHRLNPVRYKTDCEELYGRILDGRNVLSSVQGNCSTHTEEIWKRMFPGESYELNVSSCFLSEDVKNILGAPKTRSTKYDLVSAVKRQSPFFYQVLRSHMNNDLFLDEAVARYKGFLHMIKRNWERSTRFFAVPTYDIDLIWHSHQLHPAAYANDLQKMLGRVLDHDDTDSDRTKGKKLDNAFSKTTKQWEEMFGLRYWRAGAMYRGNAPSTLKVCSSQLDATSRKVTPFNEHQNLIQLQKRMLMEIMLEIVGVKNLPDGHKGDLFVTFRKEQWDLFFKSERRLGISSETCKKAVASFQCEHTGELVFELLSYSPCELPTSRATIRLGATTISLDNLVKTGSQLSVEKWFELVPYSTDFDSKPVNLRIALSFTPPVPAPPLKEDGAANQFCSFFAEKGGEAIREKDFNLEHSRECGNHWSSPCGGCGGCGSGCGSGCGGACTHSGCGRAPYGGGSCIDKAVTENLSNPKDSVSGSRYLPTKLQAV